MQTKVFPIDYSDPMNGIIKYLRTTGKLNFISATESSYYTSYKPASYLLQHATSSLFRLGYDKVGEYFEVHFLKGLAVSLTGYGFMGQTRDCTVPRNWNVSCMSTNPPTLLANEVNNNNLCPEGSSSTCVFCSSYKKKAYEVSKKNVYCTDIRFTTTGRNAKNIVYYFGLGGVELFGKIGEIGNILGRRKCTCYHRSVFRPRFVVIYCFIHYQ